MKASIIITAYNMAAYVRKAVESALKQQTVHDLEVIVVEDCSTDNTLDIINGMAAEHSNLRIIQHARNMGAGWARRTGIEAATGDYVLTLDADDWLQPTFIHTLAEAAIRYDADVASGGVTILRDERTGAYEAKCYGNLVVSGAAQIRDFIQEDIMFMANKLIRRKLFDIIPYSTRRYIEDTPTILPILYHANKTVYVNHPGYVYRMQPNSLTHTKTEFKSCLFRALCAKDMYLFFQDKGEEYTDIFCNTKFLSQLISELNATRPSQKEMLQWADEIRELYTFYNKHKHLLQ